MSLLLLIFWGHKLQASTFVALEIPEDIKKSAETIQKSINLLLNQNGLPPVTRIPKHRMHMTLQFISTKDLSQQQLTKISQVLTNVPGQFGPFDISDSFLRAQFDIIGKRNSLVFKLNPQPEELKALVQAIRKEFDAQGIAYEGKLPFLAHLSIGSTNDQQVINFLKSQRMIPPKPVQRFIVDRFILKSAFKDVTTFNLTGKPALAKQKTTPELAKLQNDLQQLQNSLVKLDVALSALI